MLLKNQASADAEILIDRKTHSITLTRVLAASREQVFEAWTRPEQVTCWWDPTGEPLAECEIDLRPGGAFKFVNCAGGAAHSFAGVYNAIARPDHLAFEAFGAVGRVVFEENGTNTLLTVTIKCGSAAHLEEYLKVGIHIGTGRTLDNLVAYIAGMHLPTFGSSPEISIVRG